MLLSLLGLLELLLQKAMRRSLSQLQALALSAVQQQLLPVVQRLLLEVVVQQLLREVRLGLLALGPTFRVLALRQVASQTGASETLALLRAPTATTPIWLCSCHVHTHVSSPPLGSSRCYCSSKSSRTPWCHTRSSSVASQC